MTKSELSTHVAAQASLSKAAADRAVNAVFSAITGALAKEETVTIAASKTPSFKAGKSLRDAVR